MSVEQAEDSASVALKMPLDIDPIDEAFIKHLSKSDQIFNSQS
jgi:hypothetical protein